MEYEIQFVQCRRQILFGLSAVLTGVAGCIAESDDTASFSVSEPTIEQGETVAIDIDATNALRLRFSEPPVEAQPSNIETSGDLKSVFDILFENADFTPSPDAIWESEPPTWEWSSGQNIEGQLPIRAFSDAPPGTYQLALSVEKEAAEKEIIVDVTVES